MSRSRVMQTPAAMRPWLLLLIAIGSLAPAGTARAQGGPFVFSVTTPEGGPSAAQVTLDAAFGERPFDTSTEAGRLEQRVGLQASFGGRFTLLAGLGVSPDERDARISQRAELLVNLLGASRHGVSLAAGGGLRHESGGVDVVVGRIALGRPIGVSRLQTNVVLEKPLAVQRDAVDVVTTAGWTRPVTSAVWIGIEGIGEDLEGFWEPDEAEGGARLLIGPSFRIAPSARRWALALTGGPVLRASTSTRTSTAERSLAAQTARRGFALRTSLSYLF
jgi:hypothetical protein